MFFLQILRDWIEHGSERTISYSDSLKLVASKGYSQEVCSDTARALDLSDTYTHEGSRRMLTRVRSSRCMADRWKQLCHICWMNTHKFYRSSCAEYQQTPLHTRMINSPTQVVVSLIENVRCWKTLTHNYPPSPFLQTPIPYSTQSVSYKIFSLSCNLRRVDSCSSYVTTSIYNRGERRAHNYPKRC